MGLLTDDDRESSTGSRVHFIRPSRFASTPRRNTRRPAKVIDCQVHRRPPTRCPPEG
ncbi:hypothetical protein I553_6181 [Mycobacterium xenopi 4042]|uniref:Uncharacterized protein n=1 Tax=Mycobacterium xenopi 4042 TaxID=1299334 RepID=X8BFV4_MYCXE|nr:hypothetical protein I553_6181 [Mycobacterium xenopi 4042]